MSKSSTPAVAPDATRVKWRRGSVAESGGRSVAAAAPAEAAQKRRLGRSNER